MEPEDWGYMQMKNIKGEMSYFKQRRRGINGLTDRQKMLNMMLLPFKMLILAG